jgi:AcrR family transcriptional regulator
MRRVLSLADIDEFRDRVCIAATELFTEFGEEGFNMRLLSGRLGVSAMTAYRYFKDKNEILAAVRARAFGRLADRLEAAYDAADSTEQTLAALSRVCVEFAREERLHYESMFDLSQSRAAAAPELRREEDRAREAFTMPLRSLAHAGFCNGDPEVIGQMLWSSLHGVMALNLAGKLSGADRDRMIAEMVRVLVGFCGAIVEFRPPESGLADDHPSFRPNASGGHRRTSVPAIDNTRIP